MTPSEDNVEADAAASVEVNVIRFYFAAVDIRRFLQQAGGDGDTRASSLARLRALCC